jgi:prepilin-type N-terminal cleavage/methylation domain-containing protein
MVFNPQSAPILKKRGFTFIELLVSVAILILVLAFGPFIGTAIFRDYQTSQEANYLETNLRGGQLFSWGQKNDSSFGIRFFEDKYFLFEGSSFDKKTAILRSHPLPKGFKIEGPREIVFKKGTGKPSWDGIIRILEITKEGVILHKREIHINLEGNIETLK